MWDEATLQEPCPAEAQACSAKLVCLSAGRECTRICLDVSVSNLWEGSDLFALALEVKMTGYRCGPLDDGQKAIDPGNHPCLHGERLGEPGIVAGHRVPPFFRTGEAPQMTTDPGSLKVGEQTREGGMRS